jgi:RNA polymerase sigma-70 factor (ECF subfamily)
VPVEDGVSGGQIVREDEFEQLLRPHMEILFGYALRLTRHRPDAEDLLQESIFRGFRGLSGFRRGTHFKAWMFRIVTNTFISRRRREQRAPRVVDLETVPDPEAAVNAELDDAATDWNTVYSELVEDDMKRALDDLPQDFRVPLLLSSLGGLRYKEISEVLDVPIGTVMSRLFRARQRLRRSLRDYAVEKGIHVNALGEEG